MDTFLAGAIQDAPELAAGISDKLKAAAAEADFAPSSRTVHTLGTEARLLAEEARLTRLEMGRFAAWIHDAYAPEVAKVFTNASAAGLDYVQPVTANVTAGGAGGADQRRSPRLQYAGQGSPGLGGAGFGAAACRPDPRGATEASEYVEHVTLPLGTEGYDSAQHASDCAAHQMEGAAIIRLTFVLHTARKPPPEHDELVYGVDPANMPKLYKSYKGASGTLLWDLANSDKTTMAQMRDHMHRAQQSARMLDPRFATRISDHWGEMQQYFGDSIVMIRAYYRKYLQLYAGRGLPMLVDKDILVLILCSTFQSSNLGEGDTKSGEQLEKQTKLIESLKDQVSDLKASVGSFKEEIKQIKEQVKELKAPKAFCNWCKQKGFPAVGHKESDCLKKKAAKDAGDDV